MVLEVAKKKYSLERVGKIALPNKKNHLIGSLSHVKKWMFHFHLAD